MTLTVKTSQGHYDIILEKGALARVGEYIPLDRRVLIVTDSGVPASYAQTVAAAARTPYLVTLPEGEGSKSLARYEELLSLMLREGFTRTDAVVAVGGGVVGDLSGFVAASYMRGVDFYNIPTTLLSQVDSSIGGKTAVNLGGVKNAVGAFYPPRRVLIDPALLGTLSPRHFAAGMAEALKMAITSDSLLFDMIEEADIDTVLPEIIYRALAVKKSVVEADEKEKGLRRVLNFGHTLGHGIESAGGLEKFLHGEAVALGMIPMIAPALRPRLQAVLKKLGLPTVSGLDPDTVLAAVSHDKKMSGTDIRYIYVDRIGSFAEKCLPLADFIHAFKGEIV